MSGDCAHCGTPYVDVSRNKSQKYCTPDCRKAANEKAKVVRAGSEPPSDKLCSRCNLVKPPSEFCAAKDKRDGLNSHCKDCESEKNAEWRAKNQAKIREKHLNTTYGITSAEYDTLLAFQGGVCALCGKPPKERRLNVDHCHSTGEIRGLLCFRCNKLRIGDRTIDEVRADLRYLESPPARNHFGVRVVPPNMVKPKRRRRRKKK